jgi:hypothetical protein
MVVAIQFLILKQLSDEDIEVFEDEQEIEVLVEDDILMVVI